MRRGCAFLGMIGSLLVTLGAIAQDLPESSVWLIDLERHPRQAPILISPPTGYQNQPAFAPDGESVYFTSERAGGQTDIFVYHIDGHSFEPVLESPESEFSPTPIPGQNALSVVRVEQDGRQRLWRLPLDGSEPEVLWSSVEPVGYHAWLDEQKVAFFILGETFDLHLAQVGGDGSRKVYSNIGRTLRRHPETGHALFVDKNSEPWSIAALDPSTAAVTTVLRLFPGVEDFGVDPTGHFWMGFGSKLYRSDDPERGWTLVVDLGEFGLRNITRLAVEPGGAILILVSASEA